jgi:hypothetical protein
VSFIHDDAEFDDLLRIVATERGLSRGLVEKDYWVTHSLWALHVSGFDVWFKGGTSLSKGFGLIQRFSEDLDLKIEPGGVTDLPKVSNWKSEGAKATAERKAYFQKLPELLVVPGAKVALDLESADKSWRGADVLVTYPGQYLSDLYGVMSPFVRLEVGSARVTPFVPCNLESFVHENLSASGQLAAFEDNRPKAVRCVHPLVTLIEKLDNLRRRFPNESAEPATFVRHYEDAAHIVAAAEKLPELSDYPDVPTLADDMFAKKQIAALPSLTGPALTPDNGPRWAAVREAHGAIAPMFWGPRLSVEEACGAIRPWISATFG